MSVAERIILRNTQSPGDILMLTAAVRDIHRIYPNLFLTALHTSAVALWENNPLVTEISDGGGLEIVCEYPLIHKSNSGSWHFINAFHDFLGNKLGIKLTPTEFRGDIHLSKQERLWMSQVQEITKAAIPFWIVVSGGKRDFTAKWWDPKRMQTVVDHFRDRILFVQTGEALHHHPSLRGVLDFRGKTNTRQFVRLMHHAQGVVCPVTFAMHLAAAVETRGRCAAYPKGMPRHRPCVVVAGGREPMQWEAYPHHQYIHINGALRCCSNGGCWKSRVVPLGDGDKKDHSLCVDVVELATGTRRPGEAWGEDLRGTGQESSLVPTEQLTRFLPRCLDMITADEVIRRIELYFAGGVIDYLAPSQARACADALPQLGWL